MEKQTYSETIQIAQNDIYWRDLLGNPYREPIDRGMWFSPEGYKIYKNNIRVKGMSKSAEPLSGNVIYDRNYVIEKLAKEVIFKLWETAFHHQVVLLERNEDELLKGDPELHWKAMQEILKEAYDYAAQLREQEDEAWDARNKRLHRITGNIEERTIQRYRF